MRRETKADCRHVWGLRRDFRCLVRAARSAAHCLPAFPRNEGGHTESGNWVRPPPAKPRVEPEAREKDGREPGADLGLSSLSLQRSAGQFRGDAPLEMGKRGHDDQGEDGKHDPYGRVVRALTLYKCMDSLVADVGRK